MPVSLIQLYNFIELVARYKFDYLGENILTLIHNLDVWKQQGNAIVREKNIYADTTYYFLNIGQGNGKRISKQTNQPTVVNTQNYHTYCFSHELDALNYGRSGRQFLGEAFDRLPNQTFSFYIDGINACFSVDKPCAITLCW